MDDSGLNSADITFKVRFGVGPTFKKIAPNSFSFHGRGTFVIDREEIHLSGKRHRPFWFGAEEEHTFLISNVINVRAMGRYVRFDVFSRGQGKLLQVGFIAGDELEAQKIVAILPHQQTEQFAQEFAERSDFEERLQQLTPRPWVTPTIVAVNLLIFVLMGLNGVGVFTPNGKMAIQWGTNFGPLTIIDRQWWRLFTAMFIHFGILHLVFNMTALYQSGRVIERLFGSARYAALYIFAGLTGSLVSILWHPLVNSAGASGAIFGIFGALLVFMIDPRNAVPRSIMKEHRYSTAVFIGFNLLNGFAYKGIDNGAHIGGLLGGMVMGYLLARPLKESARQKANFLNFAGATALGLAILGLLIYQLDKSRELTQAQISAAEDVEESHEKSPDQNPSEKSQLDMWSLIQGVSNEDREACLTVNNRKSSTSTKHDTTTAPLKDQGLSCFFDREGKLSTIRLDSPFSGSAAGIRIGDDIHHIHKILGRATDSKLSLESSSELFYKLDQSLTLRIQLSNRDIIEAIFVVRS